MTTYAQLMEQAFGPPLESVRPAQLTGALAKYVLPPLVELWRAHGWAGYGGGIFWTTNPEDFADLLPDWDVPAGGIVIGRGAFADLFVLDAGQVFRLDPHQGDYILVAMNLDLFFEACVTDPEFRQSYMFGDLFEDVKKRQGPLKHDECYGFFPALAMGGTADAESARRVKLHEHLVLLAQLHEGRAPG